LTTAKTQLYLVKETEAPAQLERVIGAANGGVGICGVLGMRMRELKSCGVEVENGVGWQRGRLNM